MKTKVLSAMTLSVLLSVTIAAQEINKRFGLEISGGTSFALPKFTNGLKAGMGFDGTLHYRLWPCTGIYAGWGENWFSSETNSSENNQDFEEKGYTLGLQFKQPFRNNRSSYFLRAGAVYSQIDAEDDNGNRTGLNGQGPGFQLAGGVDISLVRSWSLTPVIKYNSLLRYLDSEGESMDFRYNYLMVRIGILKTF